MDIQVLLGWALVAICPPWWPWPRPWPQPPPPPPPPWWWLVSGVIGVIGGILGGWAFSQLYGLDLATDSGLLVSLVGALVGSIIVSAVAGMVMPNRARD